MGPATHGRENAASRVVEALQCRQNADMPIQEVTLVTNDESRQLDNNIPVNELPLMASYTHMRENKVSSLCIAARA